MNLARGSLFALPLLGLASAAAAQDQLWIQQLGTTASDYARGLAPDGSGGVFAAGWTWGGLAGPDPSSPEA